MLSPGLSGIAELQCTASPHKINIAIKFVGRIDKLPMYPYFV